MVDAGRMLQEDNDGNDAAFEVAVARRKAHKNQQEAASGAKRRRRITMAVQRMAVSILIERIGLRKEKELEDEVQVQIEGGPSINESDEDPFRHGFGMDDRSGAVGPIARALAMAAACERYGKTYEDHDD